MGSARRCSARRWFSSTRGATRHIGLFTFAHSAKHVALYQKFVFHARFLTAILSAPARRPQPMTTWSRHSALSEVDKAAALRGSRELTDTRCAGLDLSEEISAVKAQGLGDGVLLQGDDGLAAFAICHYGARSEAGAGTCFVKFGAVRDTLAAEQEYRWLMPARRSRWRSGCRAFWPVRTWPATRLNSILSHTGFAPPSRA